MAISTGTRTTLDPVMKADLEGVVCNRPSVWNAYPLNMKKPICAPAQSSSRRSPRRDFQKTGAINKDATVKRAAMKANVEECFRAPVTRTKGAPQKSEHRARKRSAFNRWLMRKPLHKVSRRTDETMECRGRRPRRQYARPANRLKSTCEGSPRREKKKTRRAPMRDAD